MRTQVALPDNGKILGFRVWKVRQGCMRTAAVRIGDGPQPARALHRAKQASFACGMEERYITHVSMICIGSKFMARESTADRHRLVPCSALTAGRHRVNLT